MKNLEIKTLIGYASQGFIHLLGISIYKVFKDYLNEGEKMSR